MNQRIAIILTSSADLKRKLHFNQNKKKIAAKAMLYTFLASITLNLTQSFGNSIFDLSSGAAENATTTFIEMGHTWSLPVFIIAFVIFCLTTNKLKEAAKVAMITAGVLFIITGINDGQMISATLEKIATWFDTTASQSTPSGT